MSCFSQKDAGKVFSSIHALSSLLLVKYVLSLLIINKKAHVYLMPCIHTPGSDNKLNLVARLQVMSCKYYMHMGKLKFMA